MTCLPLYIDQRRLAHHKPHILALGSLHNVCHNTDSHHGRNMSSPPSKFQCNISAFVMLAFHLIKQNL